MPAGSCVDAHLPAAWALTEALSVPARPLRPAAASAGPPPAVARRLPAALLHARPVNASGASGQPSLRLRTDADIVTALAAVSETRLRTIVEHLSDNYFTRLSTSAGAGEAQRWIEGEFGRMGLTVATFSFDKGMSSVVTATRKGTLHPEQLVIVGAHYDSRAKSMTDKDRAPGADDNGSGTAMLMELARVVAALTVPTTYSVQFCAFSGEEQGLLGSRAYAAHLADTGGEGKVVASECAAGPSPAPVIPGGRVVDNLFSGKAEGKAVGRAADRL